MVQNFVVSAVAVDVNEQLLSTIVESEVGGQTGSEFSFQNNAHIQTDIPELTLQVWSLVLCQRQNIVS